jgi:adenylate cyclase class IV
VEHFNTLRQQIQALGFSKAANKAKRDFNLITSESTTTLNSVKDEYNEIGRQGTEEAKMNSKMNNLYTNNTTASKNLLHLPESRVMTNKFTA